MLDTQARFAVVASYQPNEADRGLFIADSVVLPQQPQTDTEPSPELIIEVIEWRALGLTPVAITRMTSQSLKTIDAIADDYAELWDSASEDAFHRLLMKMYNLANGRETPKSGQLSYLQAMLGYLGEQIGSAGAEAMESIVDSGGNDA